MKKIFITIAVLFSTVCFSQAKDTANKLPADSIAIVSANDMKDFLLWVKEGKSYNWNTKATPDQVIAELYRWAANKWMDKRKKPK